MSVASSSKIGKTPAVTSLLEHRSTPSIHSARFVFEQYPKTSVNELRLDLKSVKSRANHRFRTQPITLTEINETEEENKFENESQPSTTNKLTEDFQSLEHLALSENIRRSARKKGPLKNYIERQRLKAMREETAEADGN